MSSTRCLVKDIVTSLSISYIGENIRNKMRRTIGTTATSRKKHPSTASPSSLSSPSSSSSHRQQRGKNNVSSEEESHNSSNGEVEEEERETESFYRQREIAESYYIRRIQSLIFGHWLNYIEREKRLIEESMYLSEDYYRFVLLDRGLSTLNYIRTKSLSPLTLWRKELIGYRYHQLWQLRNSLLIWRRYNRKIKNYKKIQRERKILIKPLSMIIPLRVIPSLDIIAKCYYGERFLQRYVRDGFFHTMLYRIRRRERWLHSIYQSPYYKALIISSWGRFTAYTTQSISTRHTAARQRESVNNMQLWKGKKYLSQWKKRVSHNSHMIQLLSLCHEHYEEIGMKRLFTRLIRRLSDRWNRSAIIQVIDNGCVCPCVSMYSLSLSLSLSLCQ